MLDQHATSIETFVQAGDGRGHPSAWNQKSSIQRWQPDKNIHLTFSCTQFWCENTGTTSIEFAVFFLINQGENTTSLEIWGGAWRCWSVDGSWSQCAGWKPKATRSTIFWFSSPVEDFYFFLAWELWEIGPSPMNQCAFGVVQKWDRHPEGCLFLPVTDTWWYIIYIYISPFYIYIYIHYMGVQMSVAWKHPGPRCWISWLCFSCFRCYQCRWHSAEAQHVGQRCPDPGKRRQLLPHDLALMIKVTNKMAYLKCFKFEFPPKSPNLDYY